MPIDCESISVNNKIYRNCILLDYKEDLSVLHFKDEEKKEYIVKAENIIIEIKKN